MRAALLLLIGCTTVHHRGEYQTQLNAALRDRDARIRHADGSETVSNPTEIAPDAVFVGRGRQRVPIDSVQSIRWLSPGEARWRGAGEGALIVAPLGLAIGAIAGALAHHQCQPQEVFCLDVPTTEQLAITVGVLGALAGAAVGGAIGAAVGHHDELQLTSPR